MIARGIRPDLITFADTGGEWPETYNFLGIIDEHLSRNGFPTVTIVRHQGRHNRYKTLEENCLVNETLPSLAFGRKACSPKFKARPQEQFREQWEPAKRAWRAGERVVVAIGYDAGPTDCRRSKIPETKKYSYRYFLREWGWDRERCKAEIAAVGLPIPRKSACFFCPAQKPSDLAELVDRHPNLADRILAMEANAAPHLRAIQGLWGNGCKGMRGAQARPGSMSVFIRERRALAVVQTA
jgi:hypothetical protein